MTSQEENRILRERLKIEGICMSCVTGPYEPCTDCLGTGWNNGESPSQRIELLQRLVADLSDHLSDEGCDYTQDGLNAMRRRVVQVLPANLCPDWLIDKGELT